MHHSDTHDFGKWMSFLSAVGALEETASRLRVIIMDFSNFSLPWGTAQESWRLRSDASFLWRPLAKESSISAEMQYKPAKCSYPLECRRAKQHTSSHTETIPVPAGPTQCSGAPDSVCFDQGRILRWFASWRVPSQYRPSAAQCSTLVTVSDITGSKSEHNSVLLAFDHRLPVWERNRWSGCSAPLSPLCQPLPDWPFHFWDWLPGRESFQNTVQFVASASCF